MAGIPGISILSQSDQEKTFFTTRNNFGRWMIYKFINDKEIQCCLSGDGWDTLIGYLPSTEVRYVIGNFTYISPTDKIERVKRIFLMWAPENALIKDKLKVTMYNREAQRLLGSGATFHISLQGNELSDVDSDRVIEKIKTTSAVF